MADVDAKKEHERKALKIKKNERKRSEIFLPITIYNIARIGQPQRQLFEVKSDTSVTWVI